MICSEGSPTNRIGVLDLQGGVCEHLDHLERLGITGIRVKEPIDFEGIAGLILPGGESTCLSRLMRMFDLERALLDAFQRGMKIWGTCAGAILLATGVLGEKPHLGLIDMDIERNSFGSQLDSFSIEASIPEVSPDPIPLTFIRAPKIFRVGSTVRVLLKFQDYIAAAENDQVLVTVFHPELTPCLAFHRYFALKCGISPSENRVAKAGHLWNSTSWTRLAPHA
ncbi:5'-phosphate synthase pdxT subunit [Syntrophus gentianae]|uniref:Pyridoxal 5'-phosphate synthase subunit PdxT n=1 Tax=Syntrophus gentianae TaxID=43775 RepID=A0A1H7ZT83_9BACT|nr:pyridoxal 5'-phosphate synthase glutaminase subunit PdxT [Syntrophus gentianae]SEM61852.1 5'-phosphate synthase pdxT subunit [Syntrophus gentianae]